MPTAVRAPRRVPTAADLVALGRARGLDAVGVTPVEPFATTRRHIERRRAAGLHGGMRFTYLRPERSCDPGAALPGARALVVAARSYRRAVAGPAGPRDATRPQGRVARYAWADHYGELRTALTAVARELRSAGWRARVLADDNALVDREAAYRAGLGWYGKNANLLLPGEGSWFVLGSVVTDAPLAGTGQRAGDGCGTCTRCLDGCPTGAIVAPGVVDARRCLAWLLQDDGAFPREHRVALGDRIYGCDDCQEVCPPNRRVARAVPAPPVDGADATVDLLDLLAATDDELLDRHGRWYVPRRQARYLRRNALIVLANVADPADGRVATALRAALAAPDGLVRAHAVWAARRLARDDLVRGTCPPLDDDPDPLVRAELAAPVERR
ncbi:MAG TPA: tRNA epoxyqueuosine(34) reductase QueG [Acidimicrobiales bacterium]|nr:tRNA epoxyqueuosine(34) reductase QueG [Acidimicrobiales bacterium]